MDVVEKQEAILFMPKHCYAEKRGIMFQQLARVTKLREVELRVILSNTFIFMARGGRRRE